jgi:transcriptional regulator with XRE-family HTH domain
MNKQLSIPPGAEQWLINLIELYNRSDLTMKQIAEKENLAEKSVSNVLLGKSKSPSVNLVRRIIHALGGSWRDIFGESDAVIGSQDLATLQTEVDRLSAMVDQLTEEKEALTNENLLLKEKVESLRYKIDDLKDDLISTLKHYQKTQED